MNAHIFEQPLTEFPDIPPEFGQDGGKFNYFYDQVADELDDDLVKRLKAQLDSLLIFAGLFAGVNSAFLALTLPMMSADPADDTNALLLQLVKGGNSSITSAADLPSANFTPAPTMYPVNLLFAASLTFALMSSFLAALGQQWLVYYRKRSGGGPDHQRREQLKRQLGAERWRLELVLDDILPALLQIGLVIFSISFVIYLRTISHSMSIVIAGIVGTGLIFTFGAAICTTWDRMCPYQSPLSHLLCWMVDQAKPFFSVAAALIVWLLPLPRGCIFRAVKILSEPGSDLTGLYNPFTWKDNYSSRWRLANAAASLALSRVGRHEETAANLTAASIKKVILTSESPNALIHASANLCAIRNKEALKALNEDEEILNRLYDLIEADGHKWSPATRRTDCPLPLQGYRGGLVHLALTVGTSDHFLRAEGSKLLSLDLATSDQEHCDLILTRLCSLCPITLQDLRCLSNFDISANSDLQVFAYIVLTFRYLRYEHRNEYLERLIKALADGQPCRRHLLIMTCAIVTLRVYQEGPLWHLYSFRKCFSIVQLFYDALRPAESRDHSTPVIDTPYLSKSFGPFGQFLQSHSSCEQFDRSQSYRFCIDLLHHTGQLTAHTREISSDVYESISQLWMSLERDARDSNTPTKDRTLLRQLKSRYVESLMLMPTLDKQAQLAAYSIAPYSDLWDLLADALFGIRKLAAQEPGHRENHITLRLFGLLLIKAQQWSLESRFIQEYKEFEEWANEGGCAKTPGRLNRDPDISWCDYHDILSYHS